MNLTGEHSIFANVKSVTAPVEHKHRDASIQEHPENESSRSNAKIQLRLNRQAMRNAFVVWVTHIHATQQARQKQMLVKLASAISDSIKNMQSSADTNALTTLGRAGLEQCFKRQVRIQTELLRQEVDTLDTTILDTRRRSHAYQEQSKRIALERIVRRLRTQTCTTALCGWHSHTLRKKRINALLRRTRTRVQYMLLRRVLGCWIAFRRTTEHKHQRTTLRSMAAMLNEVMGKLEAAVERQDLSALREEMRQALRAEAGHRVAQGTLTNISVAALGSRNKRHEAQSRRIALERTCTRLQHALLRRVLGCWIRIWRAVTQERQRITLLSMADSVSNTLDVVDDSKLTLNTFTKQLHVETQQREMDVRFLSDVNDTIQSIMSQNDRRAQTLSDLHVKRTVLRCEKRIVVRTYVVVLSSWRKQTMTKRRHRHQITRALELMRARVMSSMFEVWVGIWRAVTQERQRATVGSMAATLTEVMGAVEENRHRDVERQRVAIERTIERTVRRMMMRSCAAAMSSWHDVTLRSKHNRHQVARVLGRMRTQAVSMAFENWRSSMACSQRTWLLLNQARSKVQRVAVRQVFGGWAGAWRTATQERQRAAMSSMAETLAGVMDMISVDTTSPTPGINLEFVRQEIEQALHADRRERDTLGAHSLQHEEDAAQEQQKRQEAEAERQKAAVGRTVRRMMMRSCAAAMSSWHDVTQQSKHNRQKLARVLGRMRTQAVSMAFEDWHAWVLSAQRTEAVLRQGRSKLQRVALRRVFGGWAGAWRTATQERQRAAMSGMAASLAEVQQGRTLSSSEDIDAVRVALTVVQRSFSALGEHLGQSSQERHEEMNLLNEAVMEALNGLEERQHTQQQLLIRRAIERRWTRKRYLLRSNAFAGWAAHSRRARRQSMRAKVQECSSKVEESLTWLRVLHTIPNATNRDGRDTAWKATGLSTAQVIAVEAPAEVPDVEQDGMQANEWREGIFQFYDVSRDGYLDATEFKSMVRDVYQSYFSADDMQGFLPAADWDEKSAGWLRLCAQFSVAPSIGFDIDRFELYDRAVLQQAKLQNDKENEYQ